MKKFVSAMLACAMVASMSAVAFAAQPSSGLAVTGGYGFGSTSGSYTYTGAALKIGTPDDASDPDMTVKVDGNKAYYPVVGMVGPFGYDADDKALFDSKTGVTSGYNFKGAYAAPVEYGDTAYYALIQYIPKPTTGSYTDANDANTTIKGNESTYDGKQLNATGVFADDGWYTVVTESESVSSIKIKQDWEEGGDLVKSVSIVKKKVANPTSSANSSFVHEGEDDDDYIYKTLSDLGLGQFGLKQDDYAYFLAIKYADSSSVNDTDVIGTITLSKSKDPSIDKIDIDLEVNVDWEYSWKTATGGTYDYNVTDDITLKAGTNYALKFDCDDVITIEFGNDGDSYFEVDVSGQSKMLFNYDTDYNSRIAAKYPFAELNFWNGNGAKFNRVGQMFLSCEDLVGTQFLYQVTSDGKLAEVPGAEWDDSDEGFYFNTRVLGSYVISDMELDVEDEKETVEDNTNNVVTTPVAPVISNPSTGAMA